MKPMTIRIGYSDIPVEFKDLRAEDTFGYFEFYPSPKIAVDHRLAPPYAAATVLHEVLEAASAIYGLDLSEGQVRTLETVLVALVKENPESVREWMGQLQVDEGEVGIKV